MNDETRDRLRNKQNFLLGHAYKLGYKPETLLTETIAGAPTLGDLEQFVYPQFETAIDRVTRYLTGERK